ncbi:MAG: rhomboid family intramembrane serine protease, partial [Flavobacteriales bacterium]
AAMTPAGGLVFGLLYLGGIVCSALPGYRRHAADPAYRAVGASGAVSAVLFAYIMITPANGISILFFPRPLPAWVFGVLYLAYSWHMDRRGGDNVAHDAHFFGALFGIAFMAVVHPEVVPAFFEQLRS